MGHCDTLLFKINGYPGKGTLGITALDTIIDLLSNLCLKFHHCEHPTFREEEDGYQRCGQFLPYEQQGWPSFMGINGDSKFNIKAIFHKFVKKIL